MNGEWSEVSGELSDGAGFDSQVMAISPDGRQPNAIITYSVLKNL
jgi:hypothetical protein